MIPNDIITDVANELNRDEFAAAGLSVTIAQTRFNKTLRHILGRHTWRWRVNATAQNIVADQGAGPYTLGSGVQDVYAIVLKTGTLADKPMTERTLRKYFERWANAASLAGGYPDEYAMLGPTKFNVGPKPSSASFSFDVYYSSPWVDVTTFGAALTGVDDSIEEAVQLGLLARMARYLREFDAAGGYYTLYEQQLKQLVDADKATPNLWFLREEFSSGGVSASEYWKQPHVRGV